LTIAPFDSPCAAGVRISRSRRVNSRGAERGQRWGAGVLAGFGGPVGAGDGGLGGAAMAVVGGRGRGVGGGLCAGQTNVESTDVTGAGG
jgi:hypothetical protein